MIYIIPLGAKAAVNFNPSNIEKVADDELRIVWEDGHVSLFNFRFLRQNCPCASCRDELSGKRTLDPESVPESLVASSANVVGNYALSFGFSDGHGTGIFSFENLRKMCSCKECSYHSGSETN